MAATTTGAVGAVGAATDGASACAGTHEKAPARAADIEAASPRRPARARIPRLKLAWHPRRGDGPPGSAERGQRDLHEAEDRRCPGERPRVGDARDVERPVRHA